MDLHRCCRLGGSFDRSEKKLCTLFLMLSLQLIFFPRIPKFYGMLTFYTRIIDIFSISQLINLFFYFHIYTGSFLSFSTASALGGKKMRILEFWHVGENIQAVRAHGFFLTFFFTTSFYAPLACTVLRGTIVNRTQYC